MVHSKWRFFVVCSTLPWVSADWWNIINNFVSKAYSAGNLVFAVVFIKVIKSIYNTCFKSLSFLIFLMVIYFWEREREWVSGGGEERDGDRIWSKLQALRCLLRAQLGAWTHDHDMTWAEIGGSTDWATQEPLENLF